MPELLKATSLLKAKAQLSSAHSRGSPQWSFSVTPAFIPGSDPGFKLELFANELSEVWFLILFFYCCSAQYEHSYTSMTLCTPYIRD